MAAVIPSDDWMLVMRKTDLGLGIALANRKSVHPSVRIVSSPSSSATGPTAGLVPLDMTPVNMSILASSFIRRTSFTQASVPAGFLGGVGVFFFFGFASRPHLGLL